MEPLPIAAELARVFQEKGLTWKIDGRNQIPTAEDIQAVLDRAKFEVEYQAVNSHIKTPQVVMNHLTFKLADDGKVEVYVRMGEI